MKYLSVHEFKTQVSQAVTQCLWIPNLSDIVAAYVTPVITSFNRNQYRDMWMYLNLRFTDIGAIEQALTYVPNPKPAWEVYIKWANEQIKQLDRPVLYGSKIAIEHGDTYNKILQVPRVLKGYDLTKEGLEINTHPQPSFASEEPDTITFRLLADQYYQTRRWTYNRVMALDLVGVDCEFPDCPVFAVRDLSCLE